MVVPSLRRCNTLHIQWGTVVLIPKCKFLEEAAVLMSLDGSMEEDVDLAVLAKLLQRTNVDASHRGF